ncbi:MAG TPA: tRNA (N6-isopentenyl adenosine(37)-C2)-methylthiotransferase MiaB [Candidatus Dormibacteraeota bacterium]|nr:tRNA (N6-isopentenyl adenosine(37)-C2)-methylthiotransferase MiaB [Candidatus Dormibacteraeota bacterium]
MTPVDIPLEVLTGEPEKQSAPEGRTFYLETFGCQMNVHDSEKVAGVLASRGYRPTLDSERADLILYNTCSIREKAAQKVFTQLGRYKKAPEQNRMVAVLGCVAQQEGERIFERAPWVSMVCGSASYRRLPELLDRLEAGERRVTGLDLDVDETFETDVTRRDHAFRAYVTIIEGCDKHCTFCVVPFTRGPERSRSSGSVLAEVGRLAAAGYTEVQFLGQTVDSWQDPGPPGLRFSGLLLAAARVEGIRRVRFTTSHPRDFHPDIVQAIDSCDVLCDHVHLPVQSGSTRVLERMHRGYSREEYLDTISMIRSARRPISVTTDVIVGFPGETDDDFALTLDLLDRVRYDGVFAFKYSPRPNTPALEWPDQVPESEKSRRLALLIERQRCIQTERNQRIIGRSVEVLVDGRHEARQQWTGRMSSSRVVNFASPAADLLGQYVQVAITQAGPNSLVGEHIA